MPFFQIPGIYGEDVFPAPRDEMRTAIPAFLGAYEAKSAGESKPAQRYHRITNWNQFTSGIVAASPNLTDAVRGFFKNGGQVCYLIPMMNADRTTLAASLIVLETIEAPDLVCAPDLMQADLDTNDEIMRQNVLEMQQDLLDYCERMGNCFALLDSMPGASDLQVLAQCRALMVLGGNACGKNGALYYPWIKTDTRTDGKLSPPCGHVAGIYTKTDYLVGVHKAPANEVVEGVIDLEYHLNTPEQGKLMQAGVNYLWVTRGQGIRVWGAYTLSGEVEWKFVNTRRLFLSIREWIEINLARTVFEPNTPQLWSYITGELTAYFTGLIEKGKLRDFSVKCDEETNPLERRELGQVVTEIGLAPTTPAEYIYIRVMNGESGLVITQVNQSL